MTHARTLGISLTLLLVAAHGQPARAQSWLFPATPVAKLLPGAFPTALELEQARRSRRALPLDVVSPLLESQEPEQAAAAEAYLASLDTPEANRLVWARHPGEAKILGWIQGKPYSPTRTPHFRREERRLRGLVLAPGGPTEIHAVLFQGCFGLPKVRAVLVFPDHLVLWTGLYSEATRRAAPGEERRLRELLAPCRLPELESIEPMTSGETRYLYLTRDQGRRVTLDFSWPRGQDLPEAKALRFMQELCRTGRFEPVGVAPAPTPTTLSSRTWR